MWTLRFVWEGHSVAQDFDVQPVIEAPNGDIYSLDNDYVKDFWAVISTSPDDESVMTWGRTAEDKRPIFFIEVNSAIKANKTWGIPGSIVCPVRIE